jgi:hypothetical protein
VNLSRSREGGLIGRGGDSRGAVARIGIGGGGREGVVVREREDVDGPLVAERERLREKERAEGGGDLEQARKVEVELKERQ